MLNIHFYATRRECAWRHFIIGCRADTEMRFAPTLKHSLGLKKKLKKWGKVFVCVHEYVQEPAHYI